MSRRTPKARPYVATVEGEQGGVPFRLFFKRLDRAECLAAEVCGTIQDLRSLHKRKWTGTQWKDVI